MDYYFFPAKFKHQSYDLIDIHDRMKFSEVFCTRSIINGSNFLKFHVLLCFLFCTAFLLFFFFLTFYEKSSGQDVINLSPLPGIVRTLDANENSTHIFVISVLEPVFESSDAVSRKHTILPSLWGIWTTVHSASVNKAVVGIYTLRHQCSYTWHWDNWGFH